MNKNSKTQHRIIWIDWAKTILIVLVCVGHYNPPVVQKQLIWGCHIPAFFIISGYLYHPNHWWKPVRPFFTNSIWHINFAIF